MMPGDASRESISFSAFLDDARSRVDEALERYLPKPPDCPPLVSEAVRYSVFAGGKRLRPLLTLAAADAIARCHSSMRAGPAGPHARRPALRRSNFRSREAPPLRGPLALARSRHPDRRSLPALPAACAVELIHTYSLIHDDLPAMDDDTLRRGRATLHVVYGDGIAILAGDALQAEAFALLAREPSVSEPDLAVRKLRTVQIVADAAGAAGMVGGQAIDLQAAGQAPGHALTLDAAGLRAMHTRKTGALIRASAWIGAVMARAEPAEERAVAEWGSEIGLAFQIVDDILDIEGSAGELGKTAGKDAARDKPTYPALFGLDRSRAMAEECAVRARAILETAGLTEGWLEAIADWVVARKN